MGKIFNKKTLIYSVFQGLGMLIAMALVFYFTLKSTNNEFLARAMGFSTLIFSNLLLILSSRSVSKPIYKTLFEKNPAFWFVALGALLFLGLSLYAPFLSSIFKFTPLTITQILIAFGVASFSILWFEIIKYLHYIKYDKRGIFSPEEIFE